MIHWAVGAAQTSVQRLGQGELWVRNFLLVNDQLQDWSLRRNQKPVPGNGPSRSEPGQTGGEAGRCCLRGVEVGGSSPRTGSVVLSTSFSGIFTLICVVIWCRTGRCEQVLGGPAAPPELVV